MAAATFPGSYDPAVETLDPAGPTAPETCLVSAQASISPSVSMWLSVGQTMTEHGSGTTELTRLIQLNRSGTVLQAPLTELHFDGNKVSGQALGELVDRQGVKHAVNITFEAELTDAAANTGVCSCSAV